jgi:hypothetical protein
MAVETVIDLIDDGKDFIANPSLGGVAAMAVTAIPGKVADNVIPKSFADKDKLKAHFDKHGYEFNVETETEYLNIARDIVDNGYKVEYPYKGEERTGFVQLMGTNRRGEAKFGFVGTNNNSDITTLHTKSGKDFWKTLNSNAQDKIIRIKND